MNARRDLGEGFRHASPLARQNELKAFLRDPRDPGRNARLKQTMARTAQIRRNTTNETQISIAHRISMAAAIPIPPRAFHFSIHMLDLVTRQQVAIRPQTEKPWATSMWINITTVEDVEHCLRRSRTCQSPRQ